MSRVIKSPPVSEEAYHVPEAPSAAGANAPGRDKGEPQALDFEAQARGKKIVRGISQFLRRYKCYLRKKTKFRG